MRASIETIPEGTAGVRWKIRRLRSLIDSSKRHPRVRQAAADAVAGVAERDHQGEIRAVHQFVRRHVRYTMDPAGVEMFTDPATLLETRAGDCDDLVPLLGAMLEAIGHPTRVVVGGRGERWSHVWLQVDDGRGWRSLDPTAKMKGLGFDPGPRFPDTLAEERHTMLGQIHRTTGGAASPRPTSFRAQYIEAFGHEPRYAEGVKRPARRPPPGLGMRAHRSLMMYPEAGLLGSTPQLGGWFSRITKEIKRTVGKIGKEIGRIDFDDLTTLYIGPAKAIFDAMPPQLQQMGFQAIGLIPGVGPAVAPLAKGLLQGTLSVEQVAGQIGGDQAESLVRSLKSGLEQISRSGGQVPPSWTQGITGPLPGAYPDAVRPQYPGPRYATYQGQRIDRCADWGVWTMTDQVRRGMQEGRIIIGPNGRPIRNPSQWSAAKRAQVRGKTGIDWHRAIKPDYCFGPDGKLLPDARASGGGMPRPSGPPDGPTATAPGWIVPAAIAAAVFLLVR